MKQINNVLVWSLLNQELLYPDKVNRQFCVVPLNNEAPEKYSLTYKPSYFYQLLDNSFIIVDDTNQPSSIYSEKKMLPFDMDHIGGIVDLTTHAAEIKKKYEEGWSIGVGNWPG